MEPMTTTGGPDPGASSLTHTSLTSARGVLGFPRLRCLTPGEVPPAGGSEVSKQPGRLLHFAKGGSDFNLLPTNGFSELNHYQLSF